MEDGCRRLPCAGAPTFVFPDWLYVWLAFLAKAAFSLAVRPADTMGAMDAAARQDAIACSVSLGGGLWSKDKAFVDIHTYLPVLPVI